MKKNCWELKKCGRETGGAHAAELGICAASTEKKLDGIHDGKNAGRTCWVVAGTLCKGEVQGTFAHKYKNCERCEFYQLVRKEEGSRFILSAILLSKLAKA